MRILFLLIFAALSACAAPGDVRFDRSRYDRLDFKARFLDYRRQCYARGGRIYIDATGSLDRDGAPPRGSHYRCARR